MLHRLSLAVIVGASVLAQGQSVADRDNTHLSIQDTEVISVPWQCPNENELPRETKVDLEIRLEPTERGKEGLMENEDEYEITHGDLEVSLVPFAIGNHP